MSTNTDNFNNASPHSDLAGLRSTYGPEQLYEVRFDPEDPSSVALQTPEGQWMTLPNDCRLASADDYMFTALSSAESGKPAPRAGGTI